uniref:Uncharacterized protein n=1 Tax=Populus trichocarpa TaxID=3694 RepID=A0A2K1XYB6_POPTR
MLYPSYLSLTPLQDPSSWGVTVSNPGITFPSKSKNLSLLGCQTQEHWTRFNSLTLQNPLLSLSLFHFFFFFFFPNTHRLLYFPHRTFIQRTGSICVTVFLDLYRISWICNPTQHVMLDTQFNGGLSRSSWNFRWISSKLQGLWF